jgi:hypothetical protein
MAEQRLEINGETFIVDKKKLKNLHSFRIGDIVKVLKKSYSEYNVYPGTVVGFEDFQELPTIVIAYIQTNYSNAKLEFLYYNKNSKDIAIAQSNDHYVSIERDTIVERMNREIQTKETELEEMKQKRNFFIRHFNKYFKTICEDKKAA